jgi:ketosteroid isomerase-like protein
MNRVVLAFLVLVTVPGIARAQGLSFDQAQMLKADSDLDHAVEDRNVDHFKALIAEDATFSGNGGPTVQGRDAIAKAWAQYFEANGPTLTWAPSKGEVLIGKDVGYTMGNWTRRSVNANGDHVQTNGQYLTVWQKQEDGSWLAIFDTGSTEP